MWTIITVMAGFCAALAGFAPGAARACPGADAACAVAGGGYHLLAPETPAKGLALFLHGYGGRSDAQISAAGVVGPLLARGYAVAAPQGMPRRPGDKGGAWNAFADPARRDDVAFLRRVIADARARLGIDGLPVLAAGGWGVHVPHPLTWALERAEAPEGHPRFHRIADLGALPALVDRLR